MNKSNIAKRKVVPTRSRSAVNKSILDQTQGQSRKNKIAQDAAKKNQAEDERLEEIFQKNLTIAIALLPTLHLKYSTSVRKWMTRLFDPSLSKSKRNSFLAFLIFQMQNMKIFEPFNANPPQTLPDPSKLMGAAKWKAYMNEADRDFQERIKERLCLQQWGRFRKEFKPPQEFLDDQPSPTNGIICYGGCFSNHFEWNKNCFWN